MKRLIASVFSLMAATAAQGAQTPLLTVSQDGHSLEAGGEPFFWLGDTGWLMLSRLNREETELYLQKRAEQGFNVIQVMVLHKPDMALVNGVPALVDGDPAKPYTTPGSDPDDPRQYDYWDHLDWALSEAEQRGIYLALVPSWGDLAKDGQLTEETARIYGRFIAERYRDRPNIIWLNGGDTYAFEHAPAWSAQGRTIKALDPNHLMTFHPWGRTDSSWTYHNAPWLDFNMIQSGHKSYAQDPDGRGEDNWSYIEEDWRRTPAKPIIDGEPSYEDMPHGLYEADVPRWQAEDMRRYAWWAVLSGAFGHTYGENSVMQMLVPGRHAAAFHAANRWDEVLDSPGANQMRHVRALMEARDFAGREPDASLVVDNGEKYERIPVLRGPDYMIAYAYTGRPFTLRLGEISGRKLIAHWYSPRTGEAVFIRELRNAGEARFDPPGETAPGNDWVLVLDDSKAGYEMPAVPAE